MSCNHALPLSPRTEPATPRWLFDGIAETISLLEHFHDLGPSGLHTLSINLLVIAVHLDAMADRAERGEPGDAHT